MGKKSGKNPLTAAHIMSKRQQLCGDQSGCYLSVDGEFGGEESFSVVN